MTTSSEIESDPPVPACGPAKISWPRIWGLALLAALFTAVVVQYSLQYGRLIYTIQPWEDCRYVGDGLLRLNEFYDRGAGAALLSYCSNPPASPFSTYLASLAYAIFGIREWAPYAANGILILLLLLYLDRRLGSVCATRKAVVFGFALLTPMAFLTVHEYRPDMACGLFTAMGILAVAGTPLDRFTPRHAIASGVLFGLALLAKPSIFPGTLAFLAGALALSWAQAWSAWVWAAKAGSEGAAPAGWRECLRSALLVGGVALAVSLVYFSIGFREQWRYLYDALASPHRRFWVLPGGLTAHLTYYLVGPAGDAIFFAFRPVYAAILLVGALGALLRRQVAVLFWASGVLLLAYLVPTLLPNKALFGNATFAWLILFYSCFTLGAILDYPLRGRLPQVAAVALTVLLLAGALRQFRWEKWGNADEPYIRRSGENLRELADTLAAESRAGRRHVFFPTVGLLTEPGMKYLLWKQHLPPAKISIKTRVLEEDLGEYLADINNADVVVLTDRGADVMPYGMPSERLQETLLERMRTNPAFQLAKQITALNNKSFYVFDRPGPPSGAMSVESLAPTAGAGNSQTFRVVVSNTAGYANFNGALLRFEEPARKQCLIDYNQKDETWVVSRGDSWSPALPVGKPGLLESPNCALDGSASSVEKSGKQLVLHVGVRFHPVFGGLHNVAIYAENRAEQGTGWVTLGQWKSE